MDIEANKSHEQVEVHMPSATTLAPAPASGWKLPFSLQGTSSAFVAEYSIMLIALTFVLSNLVWLAYAFFGLVVANMHGGSESSLFSVSVPTGVLWLAVLSAVSLPIAAVLWSRTQGELANNPDYKGELPRSGAKGFRSFWLVVSGLSVIFMVAVALYTPLEAALQSGNVVDALVGVTLPGLVGVAVITAGAYIVTRPVHKRGLVRKLLWVIVLVTALLGVDYVWAANMPAKQTPSPYTSPYTNPYLTDPPTPGPSDCAYCGSSYPTQ
jgi:uncharacterized membrane protein YhaH (DUF805 family)